jgi:hypothetical protein
MYGWIVIGTVRLFFTSHSKCQTPLVVFSTTLNPSASKVMVPLTSNSWRPVMSWCAVPPAEIVAVSTDVFGSTTPELDDEGARDGVGVMVAAGAGVAAVGAGVAAVGAGVAAVGAGVAAVGAGVAAVGAGVGVATTGVTASGAGVDGAGVDGVGVDGVGVDGVGVDGVGVDGVGVDGAGVDGVGVDGVGVDGAGVDGVGVGGMGAALTVSVVLVVACAPVASVMVTVTV